MTVCRGAEREAKDKGAALGARRRVAVLGLDGVPYSLLKRLFEAGVMPRLAEKAAHGAFLRMETTLPPVSSVAWTSFMTGQDPGSHGIFGFTDLQKGSIRLRLPSFDDIRCPTLWQSLPGITSLVVNLPFTYPARPLNGTLISGFVAPLFERAVYPESLIPWLKSRNYRIDVDAVKGRSDREALITDLFETLSLHTGVMSELTKSRPWDLFIGVITGTDRLHHFFFDAAYDAGHPYHSAFIQYYSRVDSFLGAFSQQLGADTRLIVLSDHGFTRLKTQVYLNHWLRMAGYLSYGRPDPQGLEDISPNSIAFAMDPNRIYLNSRDRFPDGAISEAEKHGVRSRLKSELEQIRLRDLGIEDTGGEDSPDDTLFVDIRIKEDVYHGECLPMAPDLLLVPRPGYDLKATINVHIACRKDIFTGTHTHDDAFLFVDDPSVQGRLSQPVITDVAALVMEIFAS